MAGKYVNGIRLPERLRAAPVWARSDRGPSPEDSNQAFQTGAEDATTSGDTDRAAALALATEFDALAKRHFDPSEGAEKQIDWSSRTQEERGPFARTIEINRQAWFAQRREALDRTQRAIEATDAPGDQALRSEAKNWLQELRISRDSQKFFLISAILSAEAYRCLESKDEAGALRAMLNLWRTDHELPILLFDAWAKAAPAYRKEEDALARKLEETAASHRDRIDLKNRIRIDFAARRSQLAANLDLNWDHPFFGYDVREHPNQYWISINVAQVYFEIPHLDRLASTSMQAIRRKRDGSAELEASDRFWKGYLDRLSGPYAELERFRSGEGRMEPAGYFFQVQVEGEARLNVMRAALEWRREPAKAEKEQNASGAPQPDSPWYDPFTGTSLHVLNDDTGSSPTVMIYSVGPNLQDDTGSDQTALRSQGFKSFGDDIAVRIPGASGK